MNKINRAMDTYLNDPDNREKRKRVVKLIHDANSEVKSKLLTKVIQDYNVEMFDPEIGYGDNDYYDEDDDDHKYPEEEHPLDLIDKRFKVLLDAGVTVNREALPVYLQDLQDQHEVDLIDKINEIKREEIATVELFRRIINPESRRNPRTGRMVVNIPNVGDNIATLIAPYRQPTNRLDSYIVDKKYSAMKVKAPKNRNKNSKPKVKVTSKKSKRRTKRVSK